MSIEFSPNFRDTSCGTGVPPVSLKNHGRDGRDARATKSRTSARRVAANRANARKSTGPRTAAGKARVSRNALKHGLCARYGARLPSECEATFEIFCREIEEDLRPITTMQRVLLPQIVNLLWRLERLPAAQADLFAEELPKTGVKGQTLTAAQVLAKRFSDDRNNGFILLDRYERTMRNALLRLLKEFDRVGKRQAPEDPDERVPREGDRPAWTIEKQQHQEQTFARRKEELEEHIPPRDEYEASVDLTMWRCAQARRLAEQQQQQQPPPPPPPPPPSPQHAKQTQSKPSESPDGEAPERKWHGLTAAPATEQSHLPLPDPPQM